MYGYFGYYTRIQIKKYILLHIMASQVKSQISDKIYDTTLDDLLETDQGTEVDLYKINIFK